MKATIIFLFSICLALTGCTNKESSKRDGTENTFSQAKSAIESVLSAIVPNKEDTNPADDSQIDASLFSKLFNDHFIPYCRHEKSFYYEDVVADFEAAGYYLFHPGIGEPSFCVDALQDNNMDYETLYCGFSTGYSPYDELPLLLSAIEFIYPDGQGVCVQFTDHGDEFYILIKEDYALHEVSSFAEMIEYMSAAAIEQQQLTIEWQPD